MANINATLRRFENGGIILIGADTVLNVEAGTLEFTPGLYEPLTYRDRAALATAPIEGDERPTTLKFSVKLAKTFVTAGELYVLLTTRGSTGSAKTFSLTVKFPDYRGASTGESLVFAYCVLAKPPTIKAGEKFDMLEVEFEDQEVKPTAASY